MLAVLIPSTGIQEQSRCCHLPVACFGLCFSVVTINLCWSIHTFYIGDFCNLCYFKATESVHKIKPMQPAHTNLWPHDFGLINIMLWVSKVNEILSNCVKLNQLSSLGQQWWLVALLVLHISMIQSLSTFFGALDSQLFIFIFLFFISVF